MQKSWFVFGLISIVGFTFLCGFTFEKRNNKLCSKYVQIPEGKMTFSGKEVFINSFEILDKEVSNREYKEFLVDLRNKNKLDKHEICNVFSENWESFLGEKYKHYVKDYFTNDDFAQYPVLNISHEAAILYCEWLTENSNDKTIQYRLPTKEEWIYAARGGGIESCYAWGNSLLRNKEGLFLCNYRIVGDEFISVDSANNLIVTNERLNNGVHITVPVHAYWPNNYGLFNVCGNVAEMINVNNIALGGSWNSTGYDVRVYSEFKYDRANPYVGFRPVRVKKQ